MGGDGGGGGGFGDLGIGNPGSYGGQQTTTAPGFGGGYSKYASSPWHTGITNFWDKNKSKVPGIAGGLFTGVLTANPFLGLGAKALIDKGMDSNFVKDIQAKMASGEITNDDAEAQMQAHAKEIGLSPATFYQPPTTDQAISSFADIYHPNTVLGPEKLDVENTVRGFMNNTQDRGTREDPMAQNLVSQIRTITDPANYGGGGSVSTNFDEAPTINPGPETEETTEEDNMAGSPYTLTMEDLVNDPRFAMYKNAGQEQFGLARDNIMSQMPQGGQLLDKLADVETDKAKYMTNAFGNMSQDIADKQYGTSLAQMGANVSLSGQQSQRDMFDDAQMNQMMTMIGYGLASK